MIKKRSAFFSCTLVFCLLLSACDDGTFSQSTPSAPVTNPVKKTSITAVAEIEAPAEIVYVYDPTDTRDPFENPFSLVVEIPLDNAIPLTPLQKFDLDQLRLIGLIIGKGEPRAMVIAPDEKSFILKKGIKVGRNNGSVVEITTEAIIVEEQYLDFTGATKKRIQKIKLPKREE